MNEYDKIEGKTEYLVVRLGDGELYDINRQAWQEYLKRNTRSGSGIEVVAEGLTKADAENLTMLANRQREMEK